MASTFTKKRKEPGTSTPSRKLNLIVDPAASGVANEIVPAESEELMTPPLIWKGGSSSVSPFVL